MNTQTPKALFALLALGTLVALPGALALGGTFGGIVDASADADAHYGVNYQPVIDAVKDNKAKAESTVEGAIDQATGTAMSAKASAEGKAAAEAAGVGSASYEAKTSLLDGLQANLDAFGGWIQGIWVKPTVTAPDASTSAAHASKALDADVHPGYVGIDGKAHADLVQDLRSTVDLDYNLPPPPSPTMSFAASIQVALESLLRIG